jgi:hypothetical protein
MIRRLFLIFAAVVTIAWIVALVHVMSERIGAML